MNTLFKLSLLGTALVFATTASAIAAEQKGKPTKEITSLVGYNVTEGKSLEATKRESFNKMDADKDGAVTFKELQNYAMLDNEYEAFREIDKDNSKFIDIQEFASYNPTKGNAEFDTMENGKRSVRGTNLTSRINETTTYFVPVEEEIVKEESIEPASGQ